MKAAPSVSENWSRPGSPAGATGCRARVEWLLSFCGDVCRGRPTLETHIAGGFEACGQGLGNPGAAGPDQSCVRHPEGAGSPGQALRRGQRGVPAGSPDM